MWWAILIAFLLAIGYRAWKYRQIKRAGHGVQLEVAACALAPSETVSRD